MDIYSGAIILYERVKMMHHIGTQSIDTPRLLLRRFTADDTQAMFLNWANGPAGNTIFDVART